MRKTRVQSLGREDPLEEEMATHSSILAWRVPGTEELGRPHTISRQSEWLQCKSLQIINAGEGVEKREPSYTVGGNAN